MMRRFIVKPSRRKIKDLLKWSDRRDVLWVRPFGWSHVGRPRNHGLHSTHVWTGDPTVPPRPPRTFHTSLPVVTGDGREGVVVSTQVRMDKPPRPSSTTSAERPGKDWTGQSLKVRGLVFNWTGNREREIRDVTGPGCTSRRAQTPYVRR